MGGIRIVVIYSLSTLPKEILKTIFLSRHARNVAKHRSDVLAEKYTQSSDGLFGAENFEETPPLDFEEDSVIWATDIYADKGDGYGFHDLVKDTSIIVPRIEKSLQEQKKRIKGKAEVFTPSWLCNKQNNMIDDEILGENSFNIVSENGRHWVPTDSPIKFPKNFPWEKYVLSRRLEMTCGEGPYIVSPYDTTTGTRIPVVDEEGRFARIGFLDRKLRIVTENASTDEWNDWAIFAFASTFGYEWQGDNLLLARLNLINTYVEYYQYMFSETPSIDNIQKIAKIVSWNLWQMDGLKMVEPESCSKNCVACKMKKYAGHDGKMPVVRFLSENGYIFHTFEDFLPLEDFSK